MLNSNNFYSFTIINSYKLISLSPNFSKIQLNSVQWNFFAVLEKTVKLTTQIRSKLTTSFGANWPPGFGANWPPWFWLIFSGKNDWFFHVVSVINSYKKYGLWPIKQQTWVKLEKSLNFIAMGRVSCLSAITYRFPETP